MERASRRQRLLPGPGEGQEFKGVLPPPANTLPVLCELFIIGIMPSANQPTEVLESGIWISITTPAFTLIIIFLKIQTSLQLKIQKNKIGLCVITDIYLMFQG